MKTLLELLSEQAEEIWIWLDDNPNISDHEYNIANNIAVALAVNIDCLTDQNTQQ